MPQGTLDAISSGLVPGTVSGILTSNVAFVSLSLWRQSIRPAIEKVIYKDLRIDGTWIVDVPATAAAQATVAVKQSGHHVRGTITWPASSGATGPYAWKRA